MSSRRGFVINSLCLYQVTVVYNKEKPIHTSGLGVESASLAGTLHKSDSVPFAGLAPGRARNTSWLRDVHHRVRSFTTA